MVLRRSIWVLAAMLCLARSAYAQGYAGDVPMADYLALLKSITPAARDGAEAYLAAYERRCGRAMKTADLRKAMADGDGDPVLMGMIRASHYRDKATLVSLEASVRCEQHGR